MEQSNPSQSNDATDDEENIIEVKASSRHTQTYFSQNLPTTLLTPEKQWKQTSPQIIQDLYRSLLHKQRSTVHAFHLWLRLLEHNLMPNARELTVHYHTVPSLHSEYDLVRIWLNANPDRGLNRKMRVQILVFSSATSSTTSKTSGASSCGDEKKIHWPLFLRDLRHQHDLMLDKKDLLGDYDCFIAYKQYARLYTVQSHADPECPIIKECWVNFGPEMAQQFGLQPLWKDSSDKGPVWEFKTHFGLICQLLRAFAWNINIPYIYG
jgi:hypothetical protein